MSDALRALARRAIEDGRMPRRDPEQAWATLGTQTLCIVCHQIVTADDPAVEATFTLLGSRPDLRYAHAQCYVAWEQERQTLHT
jgi:hypothetical protein